ncbi:MAG: hypothetical protein CMB80_02325 [Flammeovirgaceae bacterium]|nr:hypothetical protein [Flammeovirgaceae bacterium]
MMLHGAAGCGKTALAAQASNAYMLDFDNGMMTCATLKDKFSSLRQNLEFDLFVDRKPEVPDAWLRAKAKILEISSKVASGSFKYDGVIIDSLTGMGQVIQNQIMANCGRPLGRPEIQHWGLMVSEMENILTVLTSLNLLVIVNAHEMLLQLDNKFVVKILCLGVKLPAKIPWMFDEVLYCSTSQGAQNKTNYLVSGRSTSAIKCRTRSGFQTDFNHQETGLAGLFEKIGFTYGKEAIKT